VLFSGGSRAGAVQCGHEPSWPVVTGSSVIRKAWSSAVANGAGYSRVPSWAADRDQSHRRQSDRCQHQGAVSEQRHTRLDRTGTLVVPFRCRRTGWVALPGAAAPSGVDWAQPVSSPAVASITRNWRRRRSAGRGKRS
jgi:hypothetical protein